jgi:hypothetical protein
MHGTDGRGNILYNRLDRLFEDEIFERWVELKDGALSISNVLNHFEQFIDICPPHLVSEDYAETTANGEFTGIKGVEINSGILSLTEQVTIEKTVDQFGKKEILTGADALAAISFTVVVKDKNGAEIAKEEYGISGAYPINYTFDTQAISISEAQMKNSAADSRIISNGVNFTDKFGNAWVTKGDVNDTVVPVWGVDADVNFEVEALYVNGEEVEDIWGISVDNLVTDSKGKYVGYALNCVNYNWTSDLTVKVKASVDYKYGTVSTTYEVKLAANTGN